MIRLARRTAPVFAALAVLLPIGALAQSVTGSVGATITLTSACEVNGSAAASGVDFGTLDFGTHSTLFTSATSEIDGNGSGAISVQCSPGSDATLTFNAGLNDGEATGGKRALSNGTLYIPYDIYADAGHANLLDNGDGVNITADGSAQTVNVYGRALGASGLTPGAYTDTISVTLAF